ncbi:MAG: ATP synthase F1 subunit epsilon [Bacteroidota bacterium]
MANTFQAQILTPTGRLFEGEVVGVQVPGEQGSFEVQMNHAPIVSTLQVGEVSVKKADGETLRLAVTGGFVEMNENHLTLLAEAAEKSDEIDVERAQAALQQANKELSGLSGDRTEAEAALRRAKNRLHVAGASA